MYFKKISFLFAFFLLGLVPSNGNVFSSIRYCSIKGHDLEKIEYIARWSLNTKTIVTWNSTQGNHTGHTPFGIKKAKWMSSTEKVFRKFEELDLCQRNIQAIKTNLDHVLVPVTELPTGRMDEAPGPVVELLPPGEMDEASEPEV